MQSIVDIFVEGCMSFLRSFHIVWTGLPRASGSITLKYTNTYSNYYST